MIEYGTFERKEGDFGLQEVVKDYIPRKRVRNYYDMSYLKIVRTPNSCKLVNSKIIGVDYKHHVYFCVLVNRGYGIGKTYLGPWVNFPDNQEGLNEAEKYADHVLLEYSRNKWHHPKKWVNRVKH